MEFCEETFILNAFFKKPQNSINRSLTFGILKIEKNKVNIVLFGAIFQLFIFLKIFLLEMGSVKKRKNLIIFIFLKLTIL